MDETIVFGYSSSKGGVGKSTLITLMAGYLSYLKDYKVLVIDADPQASINKKREDNQVEFGDEGMKGAYLIMEVTPDMVPDIIEDEKDNFDFIILDLAGTLTTQGNISAYTTLDKIIIPTSTSDNDITETQNFYNVLRDKIFPVRKKYMNAEPDVVIQLNRLNPKLNNYKELREMISEAGDNIDHEIELNLKGEGAPNYIYPFKIINADINTADAKFGQELNTGINTVNMEILEKYSPQCEEVLKFLKS
ncbi:MAG: ParA family protein [Reichenbachiella sp.]|uniref:ParA family protein n=1 Tax=Reichenbachiella sp. TaxID=2184521 RepID=UPI003267286E